MWNPLCLIFLLFLATADEKKSSELEVQISDSYIQFFCQKKARKQSHHLLYSSIFQSTTEHKLGQCQFVGWADLTCHFALYFDYILTGDTSETKRMRPIRIHEKKWILTQHINSLNSSRQEQNLSQNHHTNYTPIYNHSEEVTFNTTVYQLLIIQFSKIVVFYICVLHEVPKKSQICPSENVNSGNTS